MRLRLILMVSLTAPLAACGSGAVHQPEPAVDLAEAASRTTNAASARVSYSFTIEGGPADGASMRGEGEFVGQRGRITLDMSKLVPEASETQAVMIFDGKTVYVREPLPGMAPLPGGKSWFKFVEKTDDFLAFNKGDPRTLLRELAGAADFEELGIEEVRGANTTHFRGTIDSDTVDVWLGDDGLLRRVRIEGPLPTEEGERETETMEFFDFGAEVTIDLPPAHEVADFDDFERGDSD